MLNASNLKRIINKLKLKLKSTYEKGEAFRKDAQNTVEKLREAFDSMVRDFMNYKKNDSNKNRDPKKNTNKLGSHKGTEYDRISNTKKSETHNKDSDIKKKSNKEPYEDVEEMELDFNMPKDEPHDYNERNNQPQVPLLSLGKIHSNIAHN